MTKRYAGILPARTAAAVLLLACGSAAAAAGAAPSAAAGPTMFRGDPQLSGVYHTSPAYGLGGVKFSFPTGGPIRSTAAIAGATVYFGSDDGYLYAADAQTGTERWRFKTGGMVRSSPAVVNGIVYFASRDGNLYALTAASGRQLWKMAFGKDLGPQNYWDYYLSSPIIADGNLYIGSGDGFLYVLQAKNGRLVWKFDAQSRIRSTPALSGNSVVFGTMSGHVYALDRTSGTQRWKFATEGASRKFGDKGNDTTSIFSSPSIGGGVVTAGGRDGYLYGIDLATGTQKWKVTEDGSSWILSTGIEDGTVYVGGGSALVVQALDLQTGVEKWHFAVKGAVFSSISIAGDAIYFSDLTGSVYALDKNKGTQLWRFPLGRNAFSTPVIANGIVYASSDAGTLFALDGTNVAPSPAPVRRVVYRQGMKSPDDFNWFVNDVDLTVLNYFKGAGYEQVDAAQLIQLMKDQETSHGRSVVVFADSKMPLELDEQGSATPLIRRYLNAGGKVAFLGIDPVALHYDPKTGVVDNIDYTIAQRVLGVTFPPPNIGTGYYTSTPTVEGRRWGLHGAFVSNGVIDSHQDVTTLALDEFGMASSWVKNYGGPEGTGVLQLSMPRTEPTDMAQYLAAVEHGL
jgi:outer membrane protein assembly factor BamB